jgi:hypothetical protein
MNVSSEEINIKSSYEKTTLYPKMYSISTSNWLHFKVEN